MIAFLINEINIRGGTHKQFLRLLDYVWAKNIDFIVITKHLALDKTYPEFRKFENKIVVLQPKNKKYANYITKTIVHIDYMTRLGNALKNISIVNIHDNGFEYYLQILKNKKVYWQINDLPGYFVQMYNSRPLHIMNWLKNFCLRRIVMIGLPFVKEITVNVSKNREKVQKHFKRDALVFYCGIDVIPINRNIQKTITRFSNKRINLLTSGVFFPYRNYETQIEVVKILLANRYDVRLDIIGSTELSLEYTKKIKGLIQKENLEKYIIIHGQVDEERFQELHQNADLFLFLNIDQSWGLAVFEAMSCGIPVIVSESVGATEILENQKNTIFVDPFDCNKIAENIIALINNEERYRELGRNAKKICSEYTWDQAYSSKMLDLMYK